MQYSSQRTLDEPVSGGYSYCLWSARLGQNLGSWFKLAGNLEPQNRIAKTFRISELIWNWNHIWIEFDCIYNLCAYTTTI